MKEFEVFRQPESLPVSANEQRVKVPAHQAETFHHALPPVDGLHRILIELEEGARLEAVIGQFLPENSEVLMKIAIRAGKDSELRLTVVQDGSRKAAVEIESVAAGRGARIGIRGIQNAKGTQQFSFRADARHEVADTWSDLQVWCAARDESRSVFNGLITITDQAPRTEAFQKNRNLLLSPRATVDSFPKLLISHDEVKCAHGSSTSSLEPEQAYYLQARGIDRAEAERMMLRGFLREPLQWIENSEIRTALEKRLGVAEEEQL
jgi:Fe-S cluster assembly protein SufD